LSCPSGAFKRRVPAERRSTALHVQRSVHLLLSVVVFTFLPGHGAAAHVHQAADLRVCHCFLDLGSADALRDALENFIAFRNPAGVELAGQGLEGQGRPVK